MAEAIVLTAKDAEVIRRVFGQMAQLRQNTTRPPEEVYIQGTPECYIAKLPEDGIPALEFIDDSGPVAIPGNEDCGIYKIVYNPTDERYELVDTGFTKQIFNLGGESSQSDYSVVQRDKFGSWLLGSGGFRALHVKLDEDLVADGAATASVWSGVPGARVDTGENIEVSCWELEPGGTIEADTYCTAAWIDGLWDVIKRSCP